MKTTNLSGLAVLLLTIISACTQDGDSGLYPTPSRTISVFGNTQDEHGTKSTISNGIETHWVGGTDKIGIFSPQAEITQDGSSPANNVAFTAQSSAKLSGFTGTMYWGGVSVAHSFYAYYPFNSSYAGDETVVPVSLSANQTQTQADNSDHIGALDYMVASPVTVSSPTEAGEAVGSVNLTFHHVFSMIEFQIKGSGSLSQVRLTGASPLALEAGSCSIDLTQTPAVDAYTIAQSVTSKIVSVTLGTPAPLSSETAVSVYMMVLPGTQSSGMTISLKIDGTWKEMAKTQSTGGFVRGKKYVVELNADGTGWSNNVFTDDRDGNSYPYLTIGTQVWMTKNLAYLPTVTWGQVSYTTPYCYVHGYNGADVEDAKATGNYSTYGVLYNWPAAMAGFSSSGSNPSGVQGICPDGWHLPSSAEWTQLTDALGGLNVAGGKMKETGTAHWKSPNTGATNESGFTALGSGHVYIYSDQPVIDKINENTAFWSSTETGAEAYGVSMVYTSTSVGDYSRDRRAGFSVRCVKD